MGYDRELNMLIAPCTNEYVSLNQVGGKAASLIHPRQGGFNVPEVVVLTSVFFERWLTIIEVSEEWQAVTGMLQDFGSARLDLQKRAQLA